MTPRGRKPEPASTPRRSRVARMTRVQWAFGLLCTLVVAALWWTGRLRAAEHYWLDLRAQFFANFAPSPSKDLVLVAIDDQTVRLIDLPPRRLRIAQAIDELRRAGAKTIAIDIIFDSQRAEGAGDASAAEQDNAALERAFREHGNVVLATQFEWLGTGSRSVAGLRVPFRDVFTEVRQNPAVTFAELREALLSTGSLNEALRAELEKDAGPVLDALRRSMEDARNLIESRQRDSAAIPPGDAPWPASAEPVLPLPRFARHTTLASVTFQSFDTDGVARSAPLWVRHEDRLYPTLGLAAASRQLGLDAGSLIITSDATTLTPTDDSQRIMPTHSAPLRGMTQRAGLAHISWPRASREFPSLRPKSWTAQFDRRDDESLMTISLGRLVEPYLIAERIKANLAELNRGVEFASSALGEVLDDPDAYAQRAQHIQSNDLRDEGWIEAVRAQRDAVAGVVEVARDMSSMFTDAAPDLAEAPLEQLARAQQLRAIVDDLAAALAEPPTPDAAPAADRAVEAYSQSIEPVEDLDEYRRRAAIIASGNSDATTREAQRAALHRIHAAAASQLAPLAARMPSLATLDPDTEVTPILLLRSLVERAPAVIEEIDRAVGAEGSDATGELVRWRDSELPALVGGKLCFIGWAATGQTADNPRTCIAPQTPGVLVHTAIANSVLTHHIHEFAPRWIDAIAIFALGTLATWIAVRFPVVVGPPALLALLFSYFLLNGLWFWDRSTLIVTVGAPFLAAAAPWLVVILHRLLVEERGRRRTEQRFRAYVPPDVVDILVNNPRLNSMAPQRRTLTILFSDIVGFTTISESLGTEPTGRLLATYLRAMTDILQRSRATLDKYLGDGIMAFWGAPLDDPDHALHAAQAATEMLTTLDRMNAAGEFEGAGELRIRVGIATGEVNVGDFGNPPLRSAYTVIGDAVNLAARLESANRALGTSAIVNGAARDLLPPGLRLRTVARLIVKGKTEPERIYEVIGDRAPRGDATDDWIAAWEEASAAFTSGRPEECRALLDAIKSRFGHEPLFDLYLHSIEQWAASGLPPDQFGGTIVLSEK